MFQEGDEQAEVCEASKQDERLGPGDMTQPGADRHQRGMAAGEGTAPRVRRRIPREGIPDEFRDHIIPVT